jgi:hypothetical protein
MLHLSNGNGSRIEKMLLDLRKLPIQPSFTVLALGGNERTSCEALAA